MGWDVTTVIVGKEAGVGVGRMAGWGGCSWVW
jgi:hypothetical protein